MAPHPRSAGGLEQATSTDGRASRPVLTAFLEQVARTPDSSALIIDGRTLTYRELDHASAGFARLLWQRGARAGRVVCLRMEQSALSVVAVLATLRVGAAWAALEPDLPISRLKALYRDVDCAVLLCEGSDNATVESVRELPSPPAVLDAAELDLNQLIKAGSELSADPYPPVPDDSLAYLIYTSGSTGVPKGVMVSRGQLATSVNSRGAVYGDEPSVYLMAMRLSFDGMLAGMFWSFGNGHTLLLPNLRQLLQASDFISLAREYQATHLIIVPSYYRMLLHAQSRLPDSLRLVVVAGEACTPDLVNTHHDRLPAAQLANEYGPTETTISCTVAAELGPNQERIPIGRAWPGATAWVLDERLREVPPGTRGELYVGGPFVSLGYASKPGHTAERFVADPFDRAGGGRLYRTGDIVSVDEHGALHYHGRTDHQAKIRGVRIELGDIESTLERHPQVGQAVAICEVLDEGEAGSPTLVAFVMPATPGQEPPHSAQLRKHCGEYLAEQAVPTIFVPVDRIPIGSTGKADRAVLKTLIPAAGPAAELASGGDWSGHRLAVGRAWAEVLGHSDAGPEDNFFAVGGSSLKIIDLHAKLDQLWPGVMRVGELFDHITIAAQAQQLADRLGEHTQSVESEQPTAYEL